jgi:alkanesulfonate monooxygenase SsuD/methylene tetrahydromethanopterin reductase-like flavin-dependent oxidoreductase (luciferase family)
MRFDYFVTHRRTDSSEPVEQVYADGLEQMRLVDQMGVETIWFPEHHFTNTLCSPAPLLSVVDAAHRTRARLGTAVVITPYYHPLIVAEQVALADQLTQGRLDVGFGRGGFKYEYSRLATREAEAAARQQEALEIILGVWGQSDYAYRGTYFEFGPVTAVPRCFQQPCPPTWIAARTPDSMRFAAEYGLGVMMTAQREPIARLQGQVRLFTAICDDLGGPRPPLRLQREVVVTTSKAETLQAADYLWKNHVAQWHLHQDSAPTVNADTELRPLPSGYYIPPDELIARSIIGDPETCVEKIREYEALGADAFVLYTDVGQPQADVMRSLELFAERVLPHFADDRPSRRPQPVVGRAQDAPRRATPPPLLLDTAGLPDGWVTWEGEEWLAQFERVSTNGRRQSYIFDFSATPQVRAHADGSVDNDGRLRLVSDTGCPECGRPVIALVRRWQNEDRARMRQDLAERMRALRWHEQHSRRREPAGAPA